ncbi:MAG: DJ-1/PfpI family protein [Bacteroidetes Order II. Incertae sedis bacterium]|nr:DJ-1/PfpI family protein [Bacteroidetes Order II. bacterium]
MRRTKFIFIVLPEVHLLDLAGPDQVLSEAIDFGANFEIVYCGIEHEIQTSAGLGLHRLMHFSEVTYAAGDYIIIPGSRVKYIMSDAFRKQEALFHWIAGANQNGAHLVSICVGAFVMAAAGVLNQRACTTHFQLIQQLKKDFPQLKVIENVLYLSEGRIHTSAGIASGIDLMLYLLEGLTDSYFAHKVAKELVVYNRRKGGDHQISPYFNYRNHIHYGIHAVQDHIIEKIDQKHNLASLADVACMSERNLTRTFKQETGLTVNQFITQVRIQKLREFSRTPDLSRSQLAPKVGLNSEKQVERLLRQLD